MKLTMIGPGKIKDAWLKDAIEEYVKRLSHFVEVEMIDLPIEPDTVPLEQALEREAKAIEKHLDPRSFKVALVIDGKQFDSTGFAQALQDAIQLGDGKICFIIGGSRGLAKRWSDAADGRLCLSSLTFTHAMSRLLLLEQCYRGFKINANQPYHK